MSPFFVKAIQLLLSLSFLIILHELGHFIPAKLFKTRVEKFYLFFDVKFSLFKKKIGETVYGIGWLPLGGYVKIAGMIDESMDKEQMAGPPQPWEFRSKPAWQRLIIMLGGVTVNIILGFLIYMAIVFTWGSNYVGVADMPKGFKVAESFKEYGFQDGDRILKTNGEKLEDMTRINAYLFMRDVKTVEVLHQNGEMETITIPDDIGKKMFETGVLTPFSPIGDAKIDLVQEGSGADKAGLEVGDIITGTNGAPVAYMSDYFEARAKDSIKTTPITLTYKREGIEKTATITPDEEGIIGISFGRDYEVQKKAYSLGESISQGFELGYWTLHDYIAQFKYVFTKKGATQVGGFAAIGNLFPEAWNWKAFWGTTAFISIILAFMNILPIPALDGGHVMFLLYEMITGRKPNDKFMEYAQLVGFVLLIALLLFANGNDIYRAIFK
ncbi:RIP metalloprotease RseP [Aquimarina sp. TRL1]|uniref:RIP metalloprotease RseP n=1 Tax=Aquimarina sp. (strain TRL1) TaxID=2736252 RepID=UPI0015896494|nr:RIP metalloprotease RseP [Aquimarina sp. TRL1]QKX04341.1 RIP metalloprotease RseP [Aquimarina sp. TRL1]